MKKNKINHPIIGDVVKALDSEGNVTHYELVTESLYPPKDFNTNEVPTMAEFAKLKKDIARAHKRIRELELDISNFATHIQNETLNKLK